MARAPKAQRNPFAVQPDPVKGLAPQERRARASRILRDLPNWCSQYGWTWQAVARAVEQHTAGNFAASGELCDAVLSDDRVQSSLGGRVSALFGLPMKIGASHEGDKAMADAAARLWRESFPRMAPRSSLSELKRHAIMMGFGVAEIQWDMSVSPWLPKLKVWHPRNMFYNVTERQLYALTQDGPVAVVPGDGRWLVHAPHGLFRGWVHGAIRSVAPQWVLRQQAFKDWARYNERHGLPIMLATLPAVTEADVADKFIRDLDNMGAESVILCQSNQDGTKTEVTMLEASDQSWGSFKGLIDQANGSIDGALLYQQMGEVNKEGDAPGERDHGSARQSLLEFDESTLALDIREQMARPFCEFNFGNADLAPHTHWDVMPPEDHQKQLSMLESFTRSVTAMRGSGLDFDVDGLAKYYGIVIPGVRVVAPLGEYTKASTAISDGVVGTGAGAAQTGATR